jgi:auxin influx carrier (AUX1 LAX family)
MLSEKQGEETMMSSLNETNEVNEEREEERGEISTSGLKNFLWHGGSVYDAWFSCASNQVILFLDFTSYLDSR